MARLSLCLFAAFAPLILSGCHQSTQTLTTNTLSPPQAAAAANALFLSQKAYDPWILTRTANANNAPLYMSNGHFGYVIDTSGPLHVYEAGHYDNGLLHTSTLPGKLVPQTLNLKLGPALPGDATYTTDWPKLWSTADISIDGDPQAQQIIHANLFYLLSSTFPGSDLSIPPMGLSSSTYGGHIFWDAEIWMLPAILPQHPDYARSIIDYRYKLLAQARINARTHGFSGAEFPWESADTGKEAAPAEFARERHITADIGWAAWQYYLWTGDMGYLNAEGWPLLRETAKYWVSRVVRTPDGQYHVNDVLSPDETAGVVSDDAWTNAIVSANLTDAVRAAALVHQPADPLWARIAARMARPFDKTLGIPQENSRPPAPRFSAKQADTLLLIHPLNLPLDTQTQSKMLVYYAAHTIPTGPAMTASIHAIVAAKLGQSAPSLNYFRLSYQPFMRGPWDAFSEKRTTNNVYFLTGMAGSVQAVIYGFAGLQVIEPGQTPHGHRLAGDAAASLYADPHLPPGWSKLTVQGLRFRSHVIDLTILPGNKVTTTLRPLS